MYKKKLTDILMIDIGKEPGSNNFRKFKKVITEANIQKKATIIKRNTKENKKTKGKDKMVEASPAALVEAPVSRQAPERAGEGRWQVSAHYRVGCRHGIDINAFFLKTSKLFHEVNKVQVTM